MLIIQTEIKLQFNNEKKKSFIKGFDLKNFSYVIKPYKELKTLCKAMIFNCYNFSSD